MFTLVKKIMPYMIVIGIFGYVLFIAFGFNTLVTKITTEQGIDMYIIDVHTYLNNLGGINNMTPPPFKELLPTRTWKAIAGNDWYMDLVNNLALLFDWIYMPINVIMYVVEWICYGLLVIFTCLGWPLTQTNGVYDSVIIGILNWFSQNLFIDYL